MNADGVLSFLIRLVNGRFTGKVTFTWDKGVIVNCVKEEKIDTGAFRQA